MLGNAGGSKTGPGFVRHLKWHQEGYESPSAGLDFKRTQAALVKITQKAESFHDFIYTIGSGVFT